MEYDMKKQDIHPGSTTSQVSLFSPHVTESRFWICEIFANPESRTLLIVELESWALEARIMLKESGIPQMKSRVQVRLTKNLESSAWNPESTVWNPKCKTVLDHLAWSDLFYCTHTHLVHKYCKPFNIFFRTHRELFDRLTRGSISLGKIDGALLTFPNKRL